MDNIANDFVKWRENLIKTLSFFPNKKKDYETTDTICYGLKRSEIAKARFSEQYTKEWVKYTRKRILRRKRDLSILMVGSTGSGKSYSSIMMAMFFEGITKDEEQIKFIKERVIFDPEEIQQALDKKWNYNSWFVLEEVGVSMDSQKWQDKVNRELKYLFQTIRVKRYGFILTTPSMDFLQRSNRLLLHVIGEPTSIDYDNQLCKIRLKFVKKPWWHTNKGLGYVTSLFFDNEGSWDEIDTWGIPLMPEFLQQVYEEKKNDFLKKLAEKRKETLSSNGKDVKAISAKQIPTHRCMRDACKNRYWHSTVENPKKCPSCQGQIIERIKLREQQPLKIESITTTTEECDDK